MTSSEAIKAAHLDYEEAKASLFIKDLENQLYDVLINTLLLIVKQGKY